MHSPKIENHGYAVALHVTFYNFVRMHKTLRMTPAMAAGIADRLCRWRISWRWLMPLREHRRSAVPTSYASQRSLEMKSAEIQCSFCWKTFSDAEAKGHIVAGASVFICRDCVDLCVQVFAADPDWREARIAELTGMRDQDDAEISN
jgi:ClpX C4-type zinc finger